MKHNYKNLFWENSLFGGMPFELKIMSAFKEFTGHYRLFNIIIVTNFDSTCKEIKIETNLLRNRYLHEDQNYNRWEID